MTFNGNFTDAMKEHCKKKFSKLQKLGFNTDNITVNYDIINSTIFIRAVAGSKLVVNKSGHDFYAMIIDIVDILERQIIKEKEKKE